MRGAKLGTCSDQRGVPHSFVSPSGRIGVMHAQISLMTAVNHCSKLWSEK